MNTSSQKKWDIYFLAIAKVVATRATCDRLHVGAVIVKDRVIMSTGYNGSIRGTPHCDSAGHLMEGEHCVRVIHSESNAIVQAAKMGIRVDGADMYVSASPCWPCFRLIANAGIKRVFYGEEYNLDPKIAQMSMEAGVSLHNLSNLMPDINSLFSKLAI